MNQNLQTAYALAYILEKKYNAMIANIKQSNDNFYVDFQCKRKFNTNDLLSLEKEIKRLSKSNPKIAFCLKDKKGLAKAKNKYLKYWANNTSKTKINCLKIDNSLFIFAGNKIISFKHINFLTLTNVSGAYWLDSAKNEQLQRISGYAFQNKNEFNAHQKLLKEIAERDHRKIGQELELFTFSNLAGQGLPMWLPNGVTIKNEVENYIHDVLIQQDYNFTQTPVLGSVDLYKTSGHWFHYRKNMFPSFKIENEELVLRPMTCPHHMLIYKSKPRTYHDLPFRLAEHAILHRYEASGALLGLERVRGMQLVDTHVIITNDQILNEVLHCFNTISICLKTFGIKIHSIDLSLHDPKDKEKFFDNEKLWKAAESELEKCCKKLNFKYRKMVGEAAFYGPKIDFQIKTALGHIITISTIQLDFLLPARFELVYRDANNKVKTPILIHGGIIGTFERFMSILLEQTKGVLPLWLAPIQVILIPVDEKKHLKHCKKIANDLKKQWIRVKIDDSDERLGKKIRNAQIKKIPYQIVVGDAEIKSNSISYREYGKQVVNKLAFKAFINKLMKQIDEKK